MIKPEEAARAHARKRLAMVVAGGVAGVAVGLAAVYGIKTMERNAPEAACAQAAETARRLAPLAHGEVAAFAVADPSRRLPDLAFRDGSGAERHLADWRGRTVLLNLWATWCVPCRKEMPALDRLQAQLGSPAFEVVAVSIDRDPKAVGQFFREYGIRNLALYIDPSSDIAGALGIVGIPATLLVNRDGSERWRRLGPAEWDAPAEVAKIRRVIEASAPGHDTP